MKPMTRALSDLPALQSLEYTLERSPERLGWLEAVPNNERGDRAALWARLRRDGYLFLRGALEPEVSLEFRRYYFAMLESSGLLQAGTDPLDGIGAASGEFDRDVARRALFDWIVPGDEYHSLCTSPDVQGFFAWLFDGPVHLHKRKLIRHSKVMDSWVTSAHYDLVYLREGTDNLLSAWIPLGDCPVERGGLIYLEGSHTKIAQRDALEGGVRRAQHISYDLPGLAREFDTRWLVADYQAGDMVVHSPYIVHASLNNTDSDGRMRLSTDIRFQPVAERIDPRWQNHWRDDDGL